MPTNASKAGKSPRDADLAKIHLNRMRECFLVAATWCDWSDADKAEIGAAIKAAIDSGDEALIAYWAAYLEEASGLAHLTALCRAAEARIRAEKHAERERAAA